MDTLGTEVGQKMRCAVKAKLIELGTGGASGYIDDELPDYVMIMVANKRSKQQMIGDLNLFLGPQTELFVTWLHEVLQKLQEVTLPANVVQKVKRKASESENIPSTSAAKREKKDKRKDRKIKRTISEVTPEEIPSSASISDVVADHLLQKAKKALADESILQVKGGKKECTDRTDDFDIPTITEIAAEQSELRAPNEKDLAELAELQKKIEQAKRQLKAIASDESEDEDFLNIKEDAEEFDDDVNDKAGKRNKTKSPIVFDTNQVRESRDKAQLHPIADKGDRFLNPRMPIRFDNADGNQAVENTRVRRPVHERLGLKSPRSKESVISLSSNRRSEKELYVPIFRRNEIERERERDRERQKNRSRDRDRDHRERGRSRDPEAGQNGSSFSPSLKDRDVPRATFGQRIGSRVIVAPPKPEYDENDPGEAERPINSVIKIKPRPSVSPSKQASKNLLMRAVAEAQKSTALARPPKRDNSRAASPNSSSRSQKLYSKSYRDRNRQALLKRAANDNIVIEVNANTMRPSSRSKSHEDEYIPEQTSDNGGSDHELAYAAESILSAHSDEEYSRQEENPKIRSNTQFVVTLDDHSREKYVSRHKIRIVDKKLNGVEIKRLDIKSEAAKNAKLLKPSVTREAKQLKQLSAKKPHDAYSQRYEKPKEVKKLIIKNDTEDEDSTSPTKENHRKRSVSEERSTTPPLPKPTPKPLKRKRSTVSPIKFDLDEQPVKRRSKSADRENDESNYQNGKEKKKDHGDGRDENQQKISIRKTEKKYDNIPELLSSVPVEAPALLMKSKPKERCKYFPSCGKGDTCEFHHPSIPCKAFPNCKFADKCVFLHPKCKFDLTCNKVSCNFQHSVPATASAAPPLSSHVVPVQNYKSIIATPLPAICKYYPNCTNNLCNFYHPKLCRFGKNCMNKVECNFFHHEIPPMKDKFKWVASLG